jgi:hypothetical protein
VTVTACCTDAISSILPRSGDAPETATCEATPAAAARTTAMESRRRIYGLNVKVVEAGVGVVFEAASVANARIV